MERKLPRGRSEPAINFHVSANQFTAYLNQSTTGDLTHVTAEPNSTNHVSNKADGESIALLGAFQSSAQASEIFSRPSQSSALIRPPSFLLNRRQSAASENNAIAESYSRQQPSDYIAQAQPLATERLLVDSISVRNSSTTSSWIETLPGSVGEDNLGRDVEVTKDGEGEEGDSDEDWLEMAHSSSRQSLPTMQNDNITVDHKGKPLKFTNNNFFTIDRGRVITVDDNDTFTSCRTMVVMAKSEDGAFQCVSLCSHPGVGPKDYQNLSASHLPVVSGRGNHQNIAKERFKTQAIISFDGDGSTLLDSSWINCQHVWTIRSSMRCYIEGEIENFKELLKAFRAIQDKLYRYNDDSDR